MKGNGARRWKRYAEHRDSGMEWVQQIPSHWKTERLKYLASVRASNVDKKSVEGQQAVRLCNYLNVYKNEYVTAGMDFMEATATDEQIRTFTVRKGDVIITKDSETWDDIAVPAFVSDNLEGVVCGYHLAHVRPKPDVVHGEYLARCFAARGICEQFKVAANGVTRFGLGTGSIETSVFPVPPVDEQEQIIEVLRLKTTTIDTLITKNERLIELLQEKRAALINHAVTKGLDPKVPMKDSGVEWLGKIPVHWNAYHLKRTISSMCDGPFGSDMKSSHYADCGIRLIRLQNIGSGFFDDADKAYIAEEHFASLPGHDAKRGDLLIAGLGDQNHPVGRACIVPDSTDMAMVKADCFRLRLKQDRLLHHFAAHYLCSSVARAGVAVQMRGATRDRMNLAGVTQLHAVVPPLDEQQSIVAFVERETSKIDALVAKVREAIERLREYRTALISAAVTGKIDLREEVA